MTADQKIDPPAADNTVDSAEQDKPLIDPAPAPSAGEGDNTPAPAADSGEDAPLIDPVAGETPEEPEGAPESYEDFSLPDGWELSGEEKDNVHAMFRELNLPQKSAQKLVDYFTKRVLDDKAKMVADAAGRRKEWRVENRNRPDFAVENANVKRAIAKFLVEPDEKALFQDTWLSDHPVFWRVFSRIGAELGEDTPPPKGGEGGAGNSAVSRFPVNL